MVDNDFDSDVGVSTIVDVEITMFSFDRLDGDLVGRTGQF